MNGVDTLQMAFMVKDRIKEVNMDKLFAYIEKEIKEDNISSYKVKNKYIKLNTIIDESTVLKVVQKYMKKTINKKYINKDDKDVSNKKKLIDTICSEALDIFFEISDEGNGIIIIEKI